MVVSRSKTTACVTATLAALFFGVSFAAADEPPILTIDAGGHTGLITGLLVTNDGQLVSASYDKTIRVWDTKTGESLRVIRGQMGDGQTGTISEMALSPDGRTLAVVGWFDAAEQGSHPIRLYDWPVGTIRGLVTGHERPVRCVAFSRTGEFMATGDLGGVLRLWKKDGESFRAVAANKIHGERVSNVAFDPSGSPLLATTGFDGVARLFRFTDDGMSELARFRAAAMNRLYGLAFHPTGQVLAVAAAESSVTDRGNFGEVRFFDRTGQPVGSPLVFAKTGATTLAFSPDGQRLAVGCGFPGSDTRVLVFSFPDGKQIAEFAGHDDSVSRVAFLADSRTVASSGGQDHSIRLWDAATGQQRQLLGGRSRNLWNVGFSNDGRRLLWGDRFHDAKGLVGIEQFNNRGPLDWGLSLTGPELITAQGIKAVRGIIQHGDQRLELGDDTRTARLTGGGPVLASSRPQDVIYGLTFLPSADRRKLGASTPVLVAGAESLALFDAADGRRIRELVGHNGLVHAVAPSPRGDFAVSAGGDQTVRLWHLPTGQLRLSVFQVGSDWVAWTPTGFYAASPQGDRFIGWQVNRGEGRDPEHFVAAQFRKTLHRPDVVRRVLDGDRAPEPGRGVEEIGRILPPEVRIVEPVPASGAKNIRIPTSILEVKAIAKSTGDAAVTSMRLLVDGRPALGQAGIKKFAGGKPGEVSDSWTVELTPGRHRVAVQAVTAASKAVSESVEVVYVGGGKRDEVQLPSMYILAIGVSEYAGDLRLNYAAKDAVAVEQTLRAKSAPLYRKVASTVLTDKEATRQKILQGLTWLRREMTQKDVAVIFFSGHGQNDSDGNFYLLPQDVDRDNLLGTGVADGDLKKALAGIPGRVITLLDTCHAGALGGDRRKATPTLSDELIRDLVTDDYGVIVMASSMSREFSLESSRESHGYFTLALTEGLAGKADTNKDGTVYLNELDSYVSDRVKELSGGRQHPVTAKPTSIRSFPLAKV